MLTIFVLGLGLSFAAQDAPIQHVRSSEPRSLALINAGLARSATFRRLIDTLDASDVIVYVELQASRESRQVQRECLDAYLLHQVVSRGATVPSDRPRSTWLGKADHRHPRARAPARCGNRSGFRRTRRREPAEVLLGTPHTFDGEGTHLRTGRDERDRYSVLMSLGTLVKRRRKSWARRWRALCPRAHTEV